MTVRYIVNTKIKINETFLLCYAVFVGELQGNFGFDEGLAMLISLTLISIDYEERLVSFRYDIVALSMLNSLVIQYIVKFIQQVRNQRVRMGSLNYTKLMIGSLSSDL